MQIDFHPGAREELDDALGWYLERSPQASQRLAEGVAKALQSINADPWRFGVVEGNSRSCSIDRFPYQVVFRIDSNKLYVIAVAHAKRRPGYWKDRL